MILNLTKKCLISKYPLYKVSTVTKYATMQASLFKKYDAVVFQNYSVIFPPILNYHIAIVLLDDQHRICDIIKRKAIDFKLLHIPATIPSCIFVKINDTTNDIISIGDVLNLGAELTKDQKKIFLKLSDLNNFSVLGESITKETYTPRDL